MRSKKFHIFVMCGAVGLAAFGPAALADDFVYTPINPSFGGSPLNSSHLLGTANAQNNFDRPRSASEQSQAQIFSRQLEARLYSALAGQITDAIFGENARETGRVAFDGQTIEWARGLESVKITIIDDRTQGQTVIEVPTTVSVIGGGD
jgi:curli production assembly/transport component CsgF